jgi:uncharacterized repeat protein (TIGR01451 family)
MRKAVLLGVLFVLLLPLGAAGQAIIGTADGSNQAIVYPSPATGLPTPTAMPVPGLPAGTRPHGVAYYGTDNALISDFGNSRVFVVQISTATLVDTIDTSAAGYNGEGTIAVAPSLNYALVCGASTTLYRISAPFANGTTITPVTLTNSIASYQTEAIVFAPSGRAFVYTSNGIDVLDYPYTSVAFLIPYANTFGGSIAITPDGNQLLVTDLSSAHVGIFTAPFSSGSTPQILTVSGADGADGIMVTPDGTKALVVSSSSPHLHAISAPFSSASTVEEIPLGGISATGFEDVGISADSQLAILTGNANHEANTPFIAAPFTAVGATVYNVQIANGRGNGAVRFLPPGLAPGLTVSKTGPTSAPTDTDITYTINYANTGGATATNVIIHDTVPAGTTFVSATGGGTFSGGVVTWNVGDLAAGANGSVQFTVHITQASGVIVNGNYTIEADGIAPIFGPPVTTELGGPPPSPTPTPSPTATPAPPAMAEPIPATSKTGLGVLAALLALTAILFLYRRTS